MPFYSYRCTKCEAKVEVLRSLDEYDTPPTPEELEEVGVETECEHKMERFIGSAPTAVRGVNWGPGKGNW